MSDPSSDLSSPGGTRLESVEDIRRAARQSHPGTSVEHAPQTAVQRFRPSGRPPLALLCVLDDGSEKGEFVRIRGNRLVIGRQEGDVVIPHDEQMSGRHAEVGRQLVGGAWVWSVNDLNSTNGSFVRVSSALLKHGQEVLLGSRRYRFEVVPASEPTIALPLATQGWQAAVPAPSRAPLLVEMTPSGDGKRWSLTQPEIWVGRNPAQCALAIPGDPMLNPRHARLFRDNHGLWQLENAGSLNGVWIRFNRLRVEAACQFQLGEQRFLLRIA
jgi:pSer/pThr/pTyr-binding forkhead associated (FHA) protein